jgi:hypothetical protein
MDSMRFRPWGPESGLAREHAWIRRREPYLSPTPRILNGSPHTGGMPEGKSWGTAFDRVLADRHAGRLSLARHRLKNYLVNKPASMEARRLLAELYRADAYPIEAGRWGYLVEEGATAGERAAYEWACAHRLRPHGAWTNLCIRRGLCWVGALEEADDYAAAMLRQVDDAAAAEVRKHRQALEASFSYRLARAIPALRGWLWSEWPPSVAPWERTARKSDTAGPPVA